MKIGGRSSVFLSLLYFSRHVFVLDLPAVKELKSIITAALTEQVNQVSLRIYLDAGLSPH